MVVEGEVLNDFSRFFGILVAEFVAGGAVNLALKMKGDMIIKNLDLKPIIDAMMRDFLDPSWWKELSKETSIIFMDTTYSRMWIRRIGNLKYAVILEDWREYAVSFSGYGVLVRIE
ncbi:hypothetical protein Tco_0689789 [Tanacetum coccineum]